MTKDSNSSSPSPSHDQSSDTGLNEVKEDLKEDFTKLKDKTQDIVKQLESPKYLRYVNGLSGFFLFGFGIAALALAFTLDFSAEQETLNRPRLLINTPSGGRDSVATLNIFILVGIAFLLGGLIHAVFAFNLRGVYIGLLQKGANPWRWIEYAIANSLITGSVALMSGLRDFWAWVLVVTSVAVSMMLGSVVSGLLRRHQIMLALMVHFVAWVALIAPWAAILVEFVRYLNYSKDINVPVPAYIQAAVYACLVFTVLTMFMQSYNIADRWQGRTRFKGKELTLQTLNFVHKTVVGWLLLGGIMAT